MSAQTENGFGLVETMMALTVLLVVALGILPLGIIATTTTENQGHLSARTTEYAQDKLEQLLALSYGDTTSDTREFPADEIVLSTHPEGRSHWLEQGVVVDARQRFDVPVTHVVVDLEAAELSQ